MLAWMINRIHRNILSYILQPEKIPALPNPATALPTMKVIEDCAVAQMMEPVTNTARADANTILVE